MLRDITSDPVWLVWSLWSLESCLIGWFFMLLFWGFGVKGCCLVTLWYSAYLSRVSTYLHRKTLHRRNAGSVNYDGKNIHLTFNKLALNKLDIWCKFSESFLYFLPVFLPFKWASVPLIRATAAPPPRCLQWKQKWFNGPEAENVTVAL